ncbi:MAG: fibronectin type III domain-containing protein [Acidobacteria bacterium]|nr:fibronectin type III domain-containing protein [Acidobacteriota bacterium]
MTRPHSAGRAVAAWLLGAAVAGCGAKAPPLPPLIIAPERIRSMEVTRLDGLVYVEFEVPSSNTAGDGPADVVRVEVYALTTRPAEGEEEEFSEDWLEAATLVDTIVVRPPLLPGMEVEAAEGEGEPGAEGQAGPVSQGDEVTVVERLGAEAFVPVTVGEEEEEDEEEDEEDAEDDEDARPLLMPYVGPPFPPPVIRSYVAFGVSSRGREGGPSSIESIPLVDAPGPPGPPAVEYTAASVRVTWEAPDTLRMPVQDPSYAVSDDPDAEPLGPPLSATPIIEWGEPSRYVVYDVAGLGAGLPFPRPERLRPPARTASYSDSDITFGETRCYAVRVLDAVGELEIEGPESPATCVVLTDTFAPAAPTGMVAVADDDAISLVWNANSESDLAGYRILRGTAPDATLQPLGLEPVERTTYRDARVVPGQRYWYAVQAVDAAVPPNLSPPSQRIAETAR